jgi:poly(3-hydroxybutyrate) depolymerase
MDRNLLCRAGLLIVLGACTGQLPLPTPRSDALLVNPAAGAEQASILGDTVGSFVFRDERGNAARPITVWYFRPAQLDPSMRIVFLMHGSSRTGRQARDLGLKYARERGFVLLAPEFSEEHYPGRLMYDFGNMMDSTHRMLPEREWTLLSIEHLFDRVREQAGLTSPTYDIVGHSAGGQFVHRLVLFVPGARFRRAIVSTPGRYALPVRSVGFPYGLEGTTVDSAALARAFARDVVLLLGDKDTEEQTIQEEQAIDSERASDAIAQGRNRLARGLRFFAAATEEANTLGVPLAWRLRLAHGIDHAPPLMIQAAFQELFR